MANVLRQVGGLPDNFLDLHKLLVGDGYAKGYDTTRGALPAPAWKEWILILRNIPLSNAKF